LDVGAGAEEIRKRYVEAFYSNLASAKYNPATRSWIADSEEEEGTVVDLFFF
jgi:hypothetical protein